MTKGARHWIVTNIPQQYASDNPIWVDKCRLFKRGCITRKELDATWVDACTVSARLGPPDPPLHCPPPKGASYWRTHAPRGLAR